MQLFDTNYRKECGLEKFVPSSLAETMKRKELRKLLGHFLKLNSSLTAGGGNGSGQKNLTALQAKLHYLKIISDLPSYGAKCFSTNMSVSVFISISVRNDNFRWKNYFHYNRLKIQSYINSHTTFRIQTSKL